MADRKPEAHRLTNPQGLESPNKRLQYNSMKHATRPNATAIVLRADRKPAYATRWTGYVTQELIRHHGSFAKALAVLNAQA